MDQLPVTTDSRSVALFKVSGDKIGMSIVGHETVYFDARNCYELARYLNDMAFLTRRNQAGY